ncbi:MAG: host attachment protein [Pseudohongiellaceae bacterium]
MKQQLYILVADSGRAKVYRSQKPVKTLELVYDQVNFQGRKKPSEIYSDKAGGQHSGSGGHHSFAGERENHEEDRFSRDLAKMLQSEYQAGQFDALVLISPPHFLGKLRQQLDKECRKVVIKSIDKDLVRMAEQDIISHLV